MLINNDKEFPVKAVALTDNELAQVSGGVSPDDIFYIEPSAGAPPRPPRSAEPH